MPIMAYSPEIRPSEKKKMEIQAQEQEKAQEAAKPAKATKPKATAEQTYEQQELILMDKLRKDKTKILTQQFIEKVENATARAVTKVDDKLTTISYKIALPTGKKDKATGNEVVLIHTETLTGAKAVRTKEIAKDYFGVDSAVIVAAAKTKNALVEYNTKRALGNKLQRVAKDLLLA